MSAPVSHVAVIISPNGDVADVTINGHSVGRAIPARGAELVLRARELPVLALSLIADEIIVKPKEAKPDGPHA